MTYSERPARASYESMIGLARDLVQAGSVNEVLHGVSVASVAREIKKSDTTLEIAAHAGSRVGYLFRPEAERVFRKRRIREDVKKSFEETAYIEKNPGHLVYTREKDLALVLYDPDVYCDGHHNLGKP